jgi:SseB protein N-terminal domain
MTPLDTAYAAMQAAPLDDTARLQYYAQLADAELILLLEHEANGTDIVPRVFDLETGRVVLAFDSEEKLAEFSGAAAYVALPGRVIAGSLAGQEIGIGINLGAGSEMLLDAAGVAWLAQTLQILPDQTEAGIAGFHTPHVPEPLVKALIGKLRGTVGQGLLAGVTYHNGRRGHILALIDAAAGTEAALAQSASEALVFSGIDAGEIDVVFLAGADAVLGRMTRVARLLDLTVVVPARIAPKTPGMDPEKPPRLR